jgi:hypothetical protein
VDALIIVATLIDPVVFVLSLKCLEKLHLWGFLMNPVSAQRLVLGLPRPPQPPPAPLRYLTVSPP